MIWTSAISWVSQSSRLVFAVFFLTRTVSYHLLRVHYFVIKSTTTKVELNYSPKGSLHLLERWTLESYFRFSFILLWPCPRLHFRVDKHFDFLSDGTNANSCWNCLLMTGNLMTPIIIPKLSRPSSNYLEWCLNSWHY